MKKIFSDCYKRLTLLLELLGLLVVLVLIYNFTPLHKTSATFYLPSSDSKSVVYTLKSQGYTMTAIDRWLLGLKQVPTEGWYTLSPNKYGRFLFFYTLHKQKTDALMDVVVFAGETKEELTARLANDTKLDRNKLLKTYVSLAANEEADILAQRYTIARKANEEESMKYLFLHSMRTLKTFKKESFKQTPSFLQWHSIITLASIIQKESNTQEEMAFIASVIYNRIKKKMRLQMDGTLNYGIYSHTIVTPERIKSDTSPYNTYKHKGLPPHPLGTVSLSALKAAANPKDTKHLYFMLNEKGTHDFSDTYEEHLKNIKVFRAYLDAKKAKEEQGKLALEQNQTMPQLTPPPEPTPANCFTITAPNNQSITIDWQKVKL